MEWTDVLTRIEDAESGQTEFKSELGNLRAIGRAICAFANTEGGVIIVGVDDSRRSWASRKIRNAFKRG